MNSQAINKRIASNIDQPANILDDPQVNGYNPSPSLANRKCADLTWYINNLLLIFLSVSSAKTLADQAVVYGSDDRTEIADSKSQLQKEQGRSVAIVVDRYKLKKSKNAYEIQGRNFAEDYSLCSGERFEEQTVIGTCTAFLVAPDLVVTAGHCVESNWACRNTSFIFGFDDSRVHLRNNTYKTSKNNVYNCEEIVHSKRRIDFNLDFAILKLDRPVVGRPPLEYRKTGRISYWDSVYSVGHPGGLSLKMINDSKIIKNSKNSHFTANLDTLVGASGSPVMNMKSGLVEGLLINGEQDFELNDSGCQVTKKCRDDGVDCSGEFVQRFSEITPYLP